MRILMLVHAFNSLAQRLYVELAHDGHELSVEFDIHDEVTLEAVELFRPQVVLAPFLKRAIPASLCRAHRCLVVHPGPPGDRGPSALDWAILRGLDRWGVTVLEAEEALDAGPVWASHSFPMRAARKSSLYRHEVTECAVEAVREALERVRRGRGPRGCEPGTVQRWQPLVRQAERAIDWSADTTATVLRKIHSADGAPGLEDELEGRRFRLFDAHAEMRLSGPPGRLIARRHDAVCRATRDGAVWIGQLQPVDGALRFKQPATLALGTASAALPAIETPQGEGEAFEDGEIRYHERDQVGYLAFDFYNGALSSLKCERLRAAYVRARARPTRVIVLSGGEDFWCNGMHLHCIEAADSPAEASWENIHRIDDLAREILVTDSHLTIAALRGNAAAGGVFLALAADRVLARSGIVLNPHYRNMGNLYGSEYWTHVLPERLGPTRARALMERRLPVGAAEAKTLGLIDDHAGPDVADFMALTLTQARALAADERFPNALAEKRARRARAERERPLEACREAELAQMRLNFFGFDPSYHIARHRFVHRTPHGWTPLHLAHHRLAATRRAAMTS